MNAESMAVAEPNLGDILVLERVSVDIGGDNLRQVLENVAAFIAGSTPGMDRDELFYYLAAREKKGSTALGQGVAIPHCRIVDCPTELGALIRLRKPVDFVAPDGGGVDLLCVLLVPDRERANEEHLRLLAMLVRLLGDEDLCRRLRAAGSSEELYRVALQGIGK